jgi:AcrR family transcriptional regulator
LVIALNGWSYHTNEGGRPHRIPARGAAQGAVRVFGECGFESATMERIAQEADVAKGTIYLYYRSKQSIYDAALGDGLTELETRTEAAMQQAPALREAITAFITTRAEYFLSTVISSGCTSERFARHLTSPKSKASEFQALVDRQTRRLEQTIARATRRREIRRVDAAATALAIFDITRGFVARRITSTGTRDAADDVQFLAD